MAPSLVMLGYNTQLEQDVPNGDLKSNSLLLICCRSDLSRENDSALASGC